MSNKSYIYSSALILVIIAAFLMISSTEEEPKPVKPKIVAIDIPATLEFAGEDVPLEESDIRERLDREMLINAYWQSNTVYLMKLANRYFPVIEPILKEEGVPDDFKYLALAESGLQNVVSPSAAAGVWQFLKATGKEYGLEINNEVDERYHLEKATHAACKYLKKTKKDVGSWTLAAASFNSGLSRLKRLMKTQQEDSYYDLYMTAETSRYVFRIVALKTIFSNPEKFGFYIDKKDMFARLLYKEVAIDSTINDLPTFAKLNGTNYKTFKQLNPWLKQPFLKNLSHKTYSLRLPQ